MNIEKPGVDIVLTKYLRERCRSYAPDHENREFG